MIRRAVEALLDQLGWAWSHALSLLVDAALVAEEGAALYRASRVRVLAADLLARQIRNGKPT